MAAGEIGFRGTKYLFLLFLLASFSGHFTPIDCFKQHETVIHENVTIVFTEIYTWEKVFDLLVSAIQHNANKSDHEVQILIKNIFVKPIFCPKKLNCNFDLNYNHSKFYSFQPNLLVSHGGVCGLDIIPGPPSRTGEKARLFLLPMLHTRNGTEAKEGPRGVIASSSGIVFDLAGGCEGCITVYPEVGDVFTIRNHHSGKPTLHLEAKN
jgi:hypothetical protein